MGKQCFQSSQVLCIVFLCSLFLCINDIVFGESSSPYFDPNLIQVTSIPISVFSLMGMIRPSKKILHSPIARSWEHIKIPEKLKDILLVLMIPTRLRLFPGFHWLVDILTQSTRLALNGLTLAATKWEKFLIL